jgi:hypothetical protein
MMPGVPPSGPFGPSGLVEPPSGRITLWQGEDGRWLALMSMGTLRSTVIRPTRDEARAACLAFWREHTSEGREACGSG